MPDAEPSPIATHHFDEIEAALTAFSRGRSFLREYARRHGPGDPEITGLLQAIGRLERRAAAVRPLPDADALRDRVGRLHEALTEARRQMAPATRPGGTEAPDGADLPAASGEATSEVLAAAETIQETTWRMRETGIDAATCDRLDDQATAIYAACARLEALDVRVATASARIAEALTQCDGLARCVAGGSQPSLAVLNGTPLALTSEDIAFVAPGGALPA